MKNDLKWYEEEFSPRYHPTFCLRLFQAKKNMSVYDKWASIFPTGIAQCLKEYWKERMSSAPLDPRFPNVNQTK